VGSRGVRYENLAPVLAEVSAVTASLWNEYQMSHLWSKPVAFPFCRTYDVPQQSSAASKALKVLKTTVLQKAGVGGSTPSLATMFSMS
jgi:hypothetical protein